MCKGDLFGGVCAVAGSLLCVSEICVQEGFVGGRICCEGGRVICFLYVMTVQRLP